MSRVCDLMLDKRPQSGHNVSHSKRRTTRKFNPNLQCFTLQSEAFKRKFRLRIAASTIRTIDKYNGLDGFLRNVKAAKLTESARKLKKRLFAMEGVVASAPKKQKSAATSSKSSAASEENK